MLDYKLEVPFFDASASYAENKEEIDQAVANVLTSGKYINGPQVASFASKLSTYLQVNYVVPCANGTDALTIALLALGLKPGDEVLVPTFCFVAAAEAIVLLGLIPVFVDSTPDDFNIEVSSIEDKITTKTKAIIAVHMFGNAVQMDVVCNIAQKHKLFIIEDVAQALGSVFNSKKLGTIGHIGCTSFFPTKNLACFGDGGAVFSNDADIAKRLKMIANHGQEQKYQHQLIGVNSRLDTLQAAILEVKLKKLDRGIAARRGFAEAYNKAFGNIGGISLPKETIGAFHTYNQYCILLANKELRGELADYLQDSGISTMVYYKTSTHQQNAFTKFVGSNAYFPIAENLCERSLALPIYPALTDEQHKYITDTVTTFFGA